MQVVLDLDLDFFVWPVETWPSWKDRRPEDPDNRIASSEIVRTFLEKQCGLSNATPIPGRAVTVHDDAFFAWRDWIDAGELQVPFRVVHVDAHADLGLGDAGYIYLMTELLRLDVSDRRDPRRGPAAMNEGNYLAFAVANRWVSSLTYVFPTEPEDLAAAREARRAAQAKMFGQLYEAIPGPRRPNDLMAYHFHRMDPQTNLLELKHYQAWDNVARVVPGETWPAPVRCEPQVPFSTVEQAEFADDGFTHLTVAKSPLYSPASADHLLDVIADYFYGR